MVKRILLMLLLIATTVHVVAQDTILQLDKRLSVLMPEEYEKTRETNTQFLYVFEGQNANDQITICVIRRHLKGALLESLYETLDDEFKFGFMINKAIGRQELDDKWKDIKTLDTNLFPQLAKEYSCIKKEHQEWYQQHRRYIKKTYAKQDGKDYVTTFSSHTADAMVCFKYSSNDSANLNRIDDILQNVKYKPPFLGKYGRLTHIWECMHWVCRLIWVLLIIIPAILFFDEEKRALAIVISIITLVFTFYVSGGSWLATLAAAILMYLFAPILKLFE